jgi:steroid 5-alpha reductase family enzyme
VETAAGAARIMTHLLLTLVLLFWAMTLLWGFSLIQKDVSIVDIFWGPGFALVAWIVANDRPMPPRTIVVLVLVSCWALRLGGHILWRKLHEPGEDHRYTVIRKKQGPAFWWKSLFMIFWLQALLLWLVSWPLQAAVASASAFWWLDGIGAALAAGGIILEGVADWQLTRFRADESNHGKVLDSGVWGWSRHPNYFGDFMMWWGFFLIGIAAGGPWWIIASPVVMSALLIRYSGAGLMEETIKDRRPGYADYVRRTSLFVPLPPKRGA